jgi:hypothetical protein
MAKKRMLADVLWEAANIWLSADGRTARNGPHEYSCYAVDAAAGRDAGAATRFLKSLGCKPSECGTTVWDCWGDRQSIRYMWLLLAMHVAEDEGIEL